MLIAFWRHSRRMKMRPLLLRPHPLPQGGRKVYSLRSQIDCGVPMLFHVIGLRLRYWCSQRSDSPSSDVADINVHEI